MLGVIFPKGKLLPNRVELLNIPPLWREIFDPCRSNISQFKRYEKGKL
jgi:hypothetical protein